MSYSLENAESFGWSSVSGVLHPERLGHLERHVLGPRVLDAGCGGGGYVDWLARRGLETTGLDRFPEFLEHARQRGFQGTFVEGDITALPFADKSFTTTVCMDVLEHVDDVAAVAELARVTQKRLILALPRADQELEPFGVTFFHYRDTTHLRCYTEQSVRALLEPLLPRSLHIEPELFLPTAGLAHWLVTLESPQVQQELTAVLLEPPFDPPLDPETDQLWRARLTAVIERGVPDMIERMRLNAVGRSIPTSYLAVVELA